MEIRTYYNHPEVIMREPRKRKFITMAGSLKEYIDYLLEALDVEDYTFSYITEDLIFWIVSDPDRLKAWIEDTIDLEGEKVEILPPPPEVVEIVDNLAKMYSQGEENHAKIQSE